MKLRWLFVLALAFASAGATSSKSEKIQLVYRGHDEGDWRTFIFGLSCQSPSKITVIEPKDNTQPLEIVCH